MSPGSIKVGHLEKGKTTIYIPLSREIAAKITLEREITGQEIIKDRRGLQVLCLDALILYSTA